MGVRSPRGEGGVLWVKALRVMGFVSVDEMCVSSEWVKVTWDIQLSFKACWYLCHIIVKIKHCKVTLSSQSQNRL